MLADLDLALKEPLKLVEELFARGGSSLDGFEVRVQETFQLLLKDAARDEVSQDSLFDVCGAFAEAKHSSV